MNIEKKVSDELYKWQKLSEMLASPEIDAETLVDTLDGETELVEALCVVGESILDDDVHIEGLKAMIAKLTSRKSRIENTKETKRNIILRAMDSSGIQKIPGSLFTLSKKNVAPKLMVVDESQIPSKFFKPQDPVLDKKALNAAAKDGESIEGTEMSNGGITLSMRIL